MATMGAESNSSLCARFFSLLARNISRLSTFLLLGFSTFSSVTGYTEICTSTRRSSRE